jgi:capping protein alpha
MADDEYTPEQKRKIARHFVLVSPHGEVADLINDLQKVTAKEKLLNEEWQKESMTEYNKRRFVICEGDSSKIICCPQAEVEANSNKYLHPDKKLICTIDPIKQRITSESDASGNLVGNSDYEKYRVSINDKLKEYIKNHYEDGTDNPQSHSRGIGFVYVSNTGQIAIVISFKNVNVANYWTGGWQSEWTLMVDKKSKGIKIEGRIRLNVHYFEDGNVQLNSTFNEQGDVEVTGDCNQTATNILSVIKTLENDFQDRLEKFYVQMHDSTFKNMRRMLPKTQVKMDWRASIHNLVAEAASH